MDKFIEFIKNNLNYVFIAAAIILALIVILIVFAAKASANRKNAKLTVASNDNSPSQLIANNNLDKEILQPEPLQAEQEKTTLSKLETEVIKSDITEPPISNQARAASGKWQVKRKSESDYYLYLIASNGEILLSTESYTSAEGAKNGIETIKKNIILNNFQVHCDKNGKYYFKLKTSNNRLLCIGEVYSSKSSCLNGIESLKRFCESAICSDEILEELTEIFYVPFGEIAPAKEGYSGKWVIKQVTDMFMAILYASNGELLVAGESYTSVDAAKKSIANIIKNALEYNFIIDQNKNNKFYFKLRNINRNVICVGETYDTKVACNSAIESVIRFCATAKKDF